MTRYCGNCGTEVDDTAVFCPTCGRPVDEATSSEIPAAPAWPDATPRDAGPADEPDPVQGRSERSDPESPRETWRDHGRRDSGAAPPADADAAPTRVEQRPAPSVDAGEAAPVPVAAPPSGGSDTSDHGSTRSRPGSPQVDLPFTMPVTLSGWLIGGGTLLATLGVVIILIVTGLNAIDLLLFVALLGVAATVFLSARMPAIPNLRLISLVVALIAFGVALDRVGFRGGGAGELLLFMGAAAAAIGAVILELGQDQPLGGPQR